MHTVKLTKKRRSRVHAIKYHTRLKTPYGEVTIAQLNITYKRAKRSALAQQVTTRLHHIMLCVTTGRQNSPFLMDVAVLSIGRACHGQLVRMLITNEPHGSSVCLEQIAYFFFNMVQPLICKAVTRLLGEFQNVENFLKSQYLFLTTITGKYFKGLLSKFARPTGVIYNHCVSPSIRSICFHTFAGT